MQIGVITNPNSRRNKGNPNRASELQSIVGRHGEVHSTETVDSIKPILRDFLRRRARYWVADGGDGALHWMVRKGFEVLEEPEFRGRGYELPVTVPTNAGTINFVTSNVGIRGKAEDILGKLRGAVESGAHVEEVDVDSMLIEGVEVVDDHDETFRTYGFASAAGGIGQRFFQKYYDDLDPNPRTILKVLGKGIASIPFAFSPLGQMPGGKKLGEYAEGLFSPTPCKVTLDGMQLPDDDFTAVHIASMSINLGGVFKFFTKADQAGQMHALLGTPSPVAMVRNIPKMHLGHEMQGEGIVDRPCREMTLEAVGDELLEPIIDGELYTNVKQLTYKLGPRVRIPKLV